MLERWGTLQLSLTVHEFLWNERICSLKNVRIWQLPTKINNWKLTVTTGVVTPIELPNQTSHLVEQVFCSGRQTKLGTMGKAQCEMRGDVKLRRISTRHSIEPTTYRGNPTNETGNDSEKIARFYTPTRGAKICWWFSISHDFHSSFADRHCR